MRIAALGLTHHPGFGSPIIPIVHSKYATETIEIRKMIYVYRKKMLGGDNDVGPADR